MAATRKIEVFSAGCAVCEETIEMVLEACPSCEVEVHDMNDTNIAERAKSLGIQSIPAVLVDGKLLNSCSGRGVDEQELRAAVLAANIAKLPEFLRRY